MKVLIISLVVFCGIACIAEAQRLHGFPGTPPFVNRLPPPPVFNRFRRDAPEEPQGSIVLQGRQPLSGPDRQPTLDLNYQHRIIDNDRTKLDAFGGANLHRGHVSPQAGFGVEHNFNKDMFVRGHGQVEQGPRGRLSPSFGADFGWRFRRDAPEEPQGSVVLQGVQPLGGPDRQPTLDLSYKQQIIDNDRTKLDAFGGANLHRGRVSPQVGFGVEHNFNKDMFVRGHGQVEQGPRGRLSPSFGADFGWRFRRDAPEEPQGSVVLQGVQPLGGPDRQPTLDLNYQHRIIDNDRTKLDAFGGANLHRGHVSPQAGFGVEHNFNKDMFVRGHGQVEQGPRGRLSPSFGADFGWRFRRDAPEEPQGSIVLQGRQPLSGPDRQPTLDLNYQHRIIDNDRTKLDAFGGANLHRGHVSPQAGFGVEHNFNKDMFVRGHGQVEQGPRGHLSPSFGADFGWRFRREAQPYDDEEVLEEVY